MIAFRLLIQQFEIEREVLDAAFSEFHVRKTDALRNSRRVAARHFEHLIGHVDAHDLPFGTDNLSSDETDFSRAAAKIENDLAFAQITRRITATVIALDHFWRNDLEIFGVVFDRTAKFVRAFFCADGISLPDDGFSTLRLNHF